MAYGTLRNETKRNKMVLCETVLKVKIWSGDQSKNCREVVAENEDQFVDRRQDKFIHRVCFPAYRMSGTAGQDTRALSFLTTIEA